MARAEVRERLGDQVEEGAGRGVHGGGERLADQGGARETAVPAAVGADPVVQVDDGLAQVGGAGAVPLVNCLASGPGVAAGGLSQAMPALFGRLAAGQAQRGGDGRPGGAVAPGPVDQRQFLGVEAGTPLPDLPQLAQVGHPATLPIVNRTLTTAGA